MRSPSTAQDWIGVAFIVLLGITAALWLLPLSARVPFLFSADIYATATGHGASVKPFDYIVHLVPVLVGVVIVSVCAGLYFWWMGRPVIIRPAARQKPLE